MQTTSFNLAALCAMLLLAACGGKAEEAVDKDASPLDASGSADDAGSAASCVLQDNGTCSGGDRCCPIHGGVVDLDAGCVKAPNAVYNCHLADKAPYCALLMGFACYRRQGPDGTEYVVTPNFWGPEYVGEGFEFCDNAEIPGNLPACP